MVMADAAGDSVGAGWEARAITAEEANAFASKVPASSREQVIIAKNLLAYPTTFMVRGVFFEGISRLVGEARGPAAFAALQKKAGLPARITAFRQYPQRDFYKLYYLAAPLLHPGCAFTEALRRTARTFFPIFRGSMLGRTMSALMGDEPRTLLPMLAKAYNLSVSGNDHHAELAGDREVRWRCVVEPVEWYEETFAGIVEGTAADPARAGLTVVVTSASVRDGVRHMEARITW